MLSRTPIDFTPSHQEILNNFLDELTSPPVMAYPDFTKPYVLHTDASQDGLGAVLYQKQDGKLRVIAYGSRALSPAEKNYHLHSGKLRVSGAEMVNHRPLQEISSVCKPLHCVYG